MQFVQPTKFDDAIKKLGAKSPIGAQLSSREWSAVPVALRERAIWSANIESVRFVQDMKNDLADFLNGARDPQTGALKVGSRAKFIELMRRKAIAQGLGPIDPDDAGTIKDIRSERRLGLIFDTQVKSARAYGNRQQGMDPDVLNEFPGQRFIRVAAVTEERTAHVPFEDQVFLKTDLKIWLRINQDFGVPWGPWGWGCGHDVEDVDRDTCDALGLTQPGQIIAGRDDEDFNQHLKSSVRNLDPELIRFLRAKFGNQIRIENGVAEWNSAAPADPAPTVTPPPPVPQPKPAPSIPSPLVGEGQGEGLPQKKWLQPLDSLANQYKEARYPEKEALREKARELLSVPADRRKGVKFEPGLTAPKSNLSRTVEKIADTGNESIAQFVRPQLTQKTNVKVFHTSDHRAYYHPTQQAVYLNVGSDRSTAAHEIMHGIEIQNPAVLRAAAEFLLSRRREVQVGIFKSPEQPKQLRALTGMNYSGFEIAIEDDWVKRGGTVYAGKVYFRPGRRELDKWNDVDATEVLTTGIERLMADPLAFYLNDPDWFNFMIETVGIGKSL